jgi:hypothetical protein
MKGVLRKLCTAAGENVRKARHQGPGAELSTIAHATLNRIQGSLSPAKGCCGKGLHLVQEMNVAY